MTENQMIRLRHVQMQKFLNPQVIDSRDKKERNFPALFGRLKPRYSLYNQYFR